MQNKMKIYWLVLILLLLFSRRVHTAEKEQRRLPICAPEQSGNGPELRENKNQSFPGNIHVGVLPDAHNQVSLVLSANDEFPTKSEFEIHYCALQLEACASCLIGIEYKPVSAYFSEFQIDKLSKCDPMSPMFEPCFNIEFVEERADQTSAVSANGFLLSQQNIYRRSSIWEKPRSNYFNSSGNSLLVLVSMRSLSRDTQLFNYLLQNFPMTVSVYRNEEVVNGSETDLTTGHIQSPRYPHAYPATIIKNVTLENTNQSGFVRLTFDDFHINYRSQLQILDGNEIVFDSRTAQNRRPRPIQSTGPSLRILFAANYFTNLVGFKASYRFVGDEEWTDRPINCDEFLEGYGGQITLNNHNALDGMYIDCIWLIARFPSFSRVFDHLYLRVADYQLNGHSLRFEIRRGAYSEAERVFMLFEPQTAAQLLRKQPSEGFVADSDELHCAFYIRLRGFLASTNGLSIIYTQFFHWTSNSCPGSDDKYRCNNLRCIKRSLFCDRVDNCGDNSDEQCRISSNLFEESDIDVPTLLIFVIGVLGVFITFAIIFGLLSGFNKHKITFLRNNHSLVAFLRHGWSPSSSSASQNASEVAMNRRLSTVRNARSELAASIQTIGERRFYVLPEHQIRVIEAPPTYSDALKHPSVFSYTNKGFQGYLGTNMELRVSNSLPSVETTDEQSQQPKISHSQTLPSRIDTSDPQPGPSRQVNADEASEAACCAEEEIERTAASPADKDGKSGDSSETTKEHKFEEDLGFESWV